MQVFKITLSSIFLISSFIALLYVITETNILNPSPPVTYISETKGTLPLSSIHGTSTAKESEEILEIKEPQILEIIEEPLVKEEPIEEIVPDIVAIEEPEEIIQKPVREEILIEITEEQQALGFNEININTRKALVNFFCLTQGPGKISPVSGSGIIVDGKGIILTNAHIAQYFLVKDFPTDGFVDCMIRTDSPAEAMYRGELLYISPQWINENNETFVTENPKGTGEYDFAFILITETIDGSPLPTSFPSVDFETSQDAAEKDTDILLGAYPAGFLGGRTIRDSLFISTTITKVMEVFTFTEGSDNLDVISLGGSVVAQQGASGGGVINIFGKLIGLISTSSGGDTTDDRDLRAITAAHIERALFEHNKTTIAELLSGDVKAKAAAFNQTAAPTLLQIILSQLN